MPLRPSLVASQCLAMRASILVARIDHVPERGGRAEWMSSLVDNQMYRRACLASTKAE